MVEGMKELRQEVSRADADHHQRPDTSGSDARRHLAFEAVGQLAGELIGVGSG